MDRSELLDMWVPGRQRVSCRRSASRSTTSWTRTAAARPGGSGSSGCGAADVKSSSPQTSAGLRPATSPTSSARFAGRKEVRWSRHDPRGPVVDNLNVGLRDNANVDGCGGRGGAGRGLGGCSVVPPGPLPSVSLRRVDVGASPRIAPVAAVADDGFRALSVVGIGSLGHRGAPGRSLSPASPRS